MALLLVINGGSSSLKFSFYRAVPELPLLARGTVDGVLTAPHFTVRDAHGEMVWERRWHDGETLGHDGALRALFDWIATAPDALADERDEGADGVTHQERAGATGMNPRQTVPRKVVGVGLGKAMQDGSSGGSRQDSPTPRIVAVAHRVVHGGAKFTRPCRIDAQVLTQLESLCDLAPLHQPHNLAPIAALLREQPHLPQIACFDTAFHASQSVLERSYALPHALTESGIRRYGFHGLSYESIAQALPRFDARAARGRTIVAHLGNGASMCAMHSGRSVASTMGFTALDGLPMGTRSGTVDPGALLYLMDHHGMDARAIEDLLYRQSGLLGVSGVSSDMRALAASDDPRAAFAIDLFGYRIVRELGSLAAALGGIDALVFTAGIGENHAALRARVLRDAAWLGFELDEAANAAHGPRLTASTSQATAWVIPTDEEQVIARHALELLEPG